MEKLNGITINKNSLLWHRKLGQGRDAIIYAAPNNKAYKIYRDPSESRFYKTLETIQKNNYDIRLSNIPKGAIYFGDKFNGAILEREHGKQIHYVFNRLSRENQIIVLKRILAAVKELTDSYIYPHDLANTPFLPGKSSNILLDKKLYPHLIDLDGSGTSYKDNYSQHDQAFTDFVLNILFLDLMLDTTVDEEPDFADIEYYKNKFIKLGFDPSIANKLSLYEANYDMLDEAIKSYSHVPELKRH